MTARFSTSVARLGTAMTARGLIGDDPVLQRAEDQLVLRGPAQHLLGLFAESGHLAAAPFHGHHGGLPKDDALAAYVDEGISRAQIHPDVGGGEQTHSVSFQGT